MLLDRPIVAFDIETIPDPEYGRCLLGLKGTDVEIVHEMVRQRLEETEGYTEYPQLPRQRIVTICAAVLDPESERVELRCLGRDFLDEKSHIDGFVRLVTSELSSPRLVSWNGAGFDLPVVRYRAMMLGIQAPGLYRADGDWRWNNYQNRYHDMHVDLMDVLSGFGASTRVGLGTLAEMLGIPAKSFLDRPIYQHVLDGDARVIDYCKLDTVDTLLAFLVWGLHCGWVSDSQLRRFVGTVRVAIAREPFAGWRAVNAELEGWPHWGSSTAPTSHSQSSPSNGENASFVDAT